MKPDNKKKTKQNIKRARSDSGGVESSNSSPVVREVVKLPVQSTVDSTASDILTYLQKLCVSTDKNSEYAYPILIGSHAAAFWLPSFRSCADWDLIATPQQTINIVEILQNYETKKPNPLEIHLISRPLDSKIVKRRSVTTNIQQKINDLPSCLYKVVGELRGVLKFEIEITPTNNDNTGSILETSSTAQLFKICTSGDTAYMKFPIGPNKGLQCIVASIEVLETVKCSHINWPAYFSKHIADIHTIRAVLASPNPISSSVNIGFRADKTKSLTSPDRTPELESLLLTRTLETEAFRGTPGAHINLNVSNEDFLGRDDDLSVTRHVPHDNVHEIVKYGDSPIYDQLKTDKSKAMISRDLFEKAPYDQQLKCVKEEAMVIALERFLLPDISDNPTSAYKSALIRICTTLTKGWFREFAVNNFPRLSICDIELLPIRDQILKDHPLKPKNRHNTLDILKKMVTNLDDLVLVQKLIPLANSIEENQIRQYISSDETKKSRKTTGYNVHDLNGKHPHRYNHHHKKKLQFWTIRSCVDGQDPLLISFSNTSSSDHECEPTWIYDSALSIQRLNKNTDFNYLTRNKKLDIHVTNTNSGGSWGGEDIWAHCKVNRGELADEVKVIGLDDLTESLLWAFVVSLVQPELVSNGQTPLVNAVNKAKSRGLIPLTPVNHLWYDLWKYSIKP